MRLEIAVRSQDGERIDVVTFEPGALLRDVGSMKRNPLVPISNVVGVRLADPEAEAAARAS
jgi:hypothetical protein